MTAPLALAFVLIAALIVTGCGADHRRRACEPVREPGAEALASEVLDAVCDWQDDAHLPAAAIPGAKVFATSGCTTCHTYLGSGSRNLGASDLSSVGRRRDRRFFERFVANPARYGNDVMPHFAALGPRRLGQLAIFLAASKGTA